MGMLSGNWIVFGSLVVLTFDIINPLSNACRLNDEIRPKPAVGSVGYCRYRRRMSLD
jgi:hypothetical protein